ncbi:MAG TPA: FAD:protein FMN transferase, partial [Streptosporangiaceae bacterium]
GPSAVVAIRTGGLATSSTAARRWRRGGDVLHHILNPRTGLPAAPVWRTVSVSAASCTDANIASTAAIIRGRAAPAWLTGLGLPARLVDEAGRVRTVGGWPPEDQQSGEAGQPQEDRSPEAGQPPEGHRSRAVGRPAKTTGTGERGRPAETGDAP